GNLAVMESGSSLTTYYWNIYNLMGDPSISTWIGLPQNNPVVLPETIFTTWTNFSVEAAPGSYVGMTQNGVLQGAGTVGTDGTLDLEVLNFPLTPGPAHFVIMGQNLEPVVTDINVIVPAHVTISPSEIDAEVETDVLVGVFEYDGVTPKPGIEIWADGVEYESAHAFTDASGHATISVNYPYGPSVDIVGQDPADSWELFREELEVNATPLMGVFMTATTNIGLQDTFALNLPGTLSASAMGGLPDHILYAYQDGGILGQTTADDLELTPSSLSDVNGIFAALGYDLVTRDFPVIEAYGTLSGVITAEGSPASGAVIRGFDAVGDPIFTATSGAGGAYAVSGEILVASYNITVELFGYLLHEEDFFLNYGANTLDVDLGAAPSGVMTGLITDSETGDPLVATVKVYRSDDGSLYDEVSSGADGIYTTSSLPYFDYDVVVKAWHHIPVSIEIEVSEPEVLKDFVLDPTIGDLLVIDDSAKADHAEDKRGGKQGDLLAEGFDVPSGKSAADLLADLEELGYTSTVETMDSTDPLQWSNYDLLLVTSGDNISTLDNSGFRSALEAFVYAGGHLLIEGGEVGYDYYSSDPDFSQNVLHISGWNGDSSGDVTIVDPEHYVASFPNVIPTPITTGYDNYGDQDALTVTDDATMVGSWTEETGSGSIIAFDPNPAPEGGQIVFFAFDYSALDAAVRPLLLQNAVTWLMTPEIGNCAASGTAELLGESNHAGILIEALPGGGSVTTGPDGSWHLEGLYAGNYLIHASKDGWATSSEQILLSDGQHQTGINLVLTPVFEWEACESPNIPITDYNTISDDMDVDLDGTVSSVSVYVDISHTWIGDLHVWLTSPAGTEVMLHNRSGGSDDNIVGWYPDNFEPDGDLSAFAGENTLGVWTLSITDNAGADTGSFNDWCLNFEYGGGATDVSEVPTVLSLGMAFPNPFNPKTTIRFALPEAGEIELAIYDVSGRRVRTLASGLWQTGKHELVWTGRDDRGNTVSSGLYFYRLTSDGKSLTEKMLLMK
ncbi:MAG: proprotein convertase P-domain-containing protein, partial [Candidatus Krumholzibacteria bacterium]|nr:proprotein convertase P-domain-containing protein [Candidatus Krumholzibacteria bacterium]